MSPPAGRPSWKGGADLPLIYLGWGHRDFRNDPLNLHYDQGTNYYIVVSGEIIVTSNNVKRVVRGPAAVLISPGQVFGITQVKFQQVEVLVWVWQGVPGYPELQPDARGLLVINLSQYPLEPLAELPANCRREVATADVCLPATLAALRTLVEVELYRASGQVAATGDVRWKLAHSWMLANLSIQAPVPALCDYLCMSRRTLHRAFRAQTGFSPGAYFRQLKLIEARRLIKDEGWQIKAVAYHLGYRFPNDLSRALAGTSNEDDDDDGSPE